MNQSSKKEIAIYMSAYIYLAEKFKDIVSGCAKKT